MKRILFYGLTFALFALGHTGLGALTPAIDGQYDIHLYFDEKPFLDTMVLFIDQDKVKGEMHVPNDFDASIDHFVLNGLNFSFEILVPKNPSRPKDFHARYEGKFYDATMQTFAGFATVVEDNSFMASFVGHQLKK